MSAPKSRRRFLLRWSTWRRMHQAVSARSRRTSLAAKRVARREPRRSATLETAAIEPEEAHLTEEQWASVRPLLPPQRGESRQATQRPSQRAGRHLAGGEDGIVVAGDAGGIRQVGERLPTLRAVGEAGPMATHPSSIGRGRSLRTGGEGSLSDAVGPLPTASLTQKDSPSTAPGRILGSERVTKMLKTPPKAARSGPKSTSLSETTLSDAVGPLPRTPVNKGLLVRPLNRATSWWPSRHAPPPAGRWMR